MFPANASRSSSNRPMRTFSKGEIYWLDWAEKSNGKGGSQIGKLLRSRVLQHEALFSSIATSPSQSILNNGIYLRATLGFSQVWNQMVVESSHESAQHIDIFKRDFVSVLGSYLGSDGLRRLEARNIAVFTACWSKCPSISAVLSSLSRYASQECSLQLQTWAIRMLAGILLPLFDQPDISVLKNGTTHILLRFLSLPNLSALGMSSQALSELLQVGIRCSSSKEDTISCLSHLQRYAPSDVHRRICEEQRLALPLVLIAVEAYNSIPSSPQSRNYLYQYASLLEPGQFDMTLWSYLIATNRLALVLEIANDENGALSKSLTHHLTKRRRDEEMKR